MGRSSIGSGGALALGAASTLVLALGCASPAPPQPPSLHLPGPAERLHAERVGDQVQLTWSTPADTTDGVKVRGSLTAVVCREIRRAKAIGPCNLVRKMMVTPGNAEIIDVLPHDLSTGAATLLAYRIEILNDRGRSAGRSDAVYAAGGQAPSAVGSLKVIPKRGAALIQWQAQAGESAGQTAMEVHRTLAVSGQGTAPLRSERDRPAALPTLRANSPLKMPSGTPFGPSKEPSGVVTLTVGAADRTPGSNVDPGGMLDGTVRNGDSYLYVAQRVRKVTVNGEELEVRGVASPQTQFAYRDTFPPRAPYGLVSVPAGGFGGTPSVDLSWEPGIETDLLGYNVYRRAASGVFAKLNTEPVPSSSFRDLQVQPGQAYDYRVTAVDRQRNESAPSAEVHERLR